MGSLNDQANPESPYYSTVVPAYQSSTAALNSITIVLAKKLADTPDAPSGTFFDQFGAVAR